MKMEEHELLSQIKDMLPAGKYNGIEQILGGDGTRRNKFSAKWGINGSSRRVRIKVDKPLSEDRKIRSRDRGYDTENDAIVLSNLPYDEALAHGINPILDYEAKDGVIVTVEPKFTGGIALGNFFEGRKITKQEFNQIITGIIGEAVKNIPPSFREKYPEIDWKDIAGFRDVLSRSYFGVNLERVWNIIEKDLPKLKKEIIKINLDESQFNNL